MSANLQTIKDLRNYLKKELNGLYPEEEISSISNLIFKTQLGIGRLHLFTDPGQNVRASDSDRIREICAELKTGKPVQYILGTTVFFDCIIKVNKYTLIPRPETEELVDLIIRENHGFRGRILDIGTGSGCIAIALKKNLPDAQVTAVDISVNALEMASGNAILNKVAVTFKMLDILKSGIEIIGKADIIVSNPPYVLESEKSLMKNNVLGFEPHEALFVPDEDPLLFYRKIVEISLNSLNPGGSLYFEINEAKGKELRSLMETSGFTGIRIIDDINGKNRFIKAKMNG